MKTFNSYTFLFCIVLTLISAQTNAQKQIEYKIKSSPQEEATFKSVFKNDTVFLALHEQEAENKILNMAYSKGYYESQLTYYSVSNSFAIKFGHQYEYIFLKFIDSLMDNFQYESSNLLKNKALQKHDYQSINNITNQWLSYLQDHGYPFARIKFLVDSISNSSIYARLKLEKREYFTFDTLTIIGDAQLKKNYLHNFLSIEPGMAYKHSMVKEIGTKLNQLNVVKQGHSPQIFYVKNKAHIFLYLDKQKTDRIDGIIGFAPNSENSNELIITGEANLDLNNIASRNIETHLSWRSFLSNSQELRARGSYPFLFNTYLGIGASAFIQSFDSSFVNVDIDFEVNYSLSGKDQVGFSVGQRSSTLLSFDTTFFRLNPMIPSNNPYQLRLYAMNLKLNRVNRFFNAQKGFRLFIQAAAGQKRLSRDPSIDAVKYKSDNSIISIYDTSTLEFLQIEFNSALDLYYPLDLKKNHILGLSIKSGARLSDQILNTELFRLGGVNSLKGFDENAIAASTYILGFFEYRYILSDFGYLNAFWNGSWYENKANNTTIKNDFPWGIGLGAGIEIRSGILKIAYALGKEQGNPFDFQTAKFHFGVESYL